MPAASQFNPSDSNAQTPDTRLAGAFSWFDTDARTHALRISPACDEALMAGLSVGPHKSFPTVMNPSMPKSAIWKMPDRAGRSRHSERAASADTLLAWAACKAKPDHADERLENNSRMDLRPAAGAFVEHDRNFCDLESFRVPKAVGSLNLEEISHEETLPHELSWMALQNKRICAHPFFRFPRQPASKTTAAGVPTVTRRQPATQLEDARYG